MTAQVHSAGTYRRKRKEQLQPVSQEPGKPMRLLEIEIAEVSS